MRWLATSFLDHVLCSVNLEVLSPFLSSHCFHHHGMGIIALKEISSCLSALILVSMSYLYTGLWKLLNGTPCCDCMCFLAFVVVGLHAWMHVVPLSHKCGLEMRTWLSTNCCAARWMQIPASSIMYLVTNCSQMFLWGWMPNRVSGFCWLGFLPLPPTPPTHWSAGRVLQLCRLILNLLY